MHKIPSSLHLCVGEWVEVRSAEEILATLDDSQSIDGLPFMPEMLQFCGKRFQVSASAHKTADTTEAYCIRRLKDAVHIAGLRCDGTAHGGCQAGCQFFWKDSWLKRVPSGQTGIAGDQEQAQSSTALNLDLKLQKLSQATVRPAVTGGPACYRCQATEMLHKATTDVRRRERWNPLFYVRDFTSGNVSFFDFVRFGLLAMVNSFSRRWFNYSYPYVKGLAGDKTPTAELHLQAGEWVRVRNRHEIMKTINSRSQNRGMWFDVEMLLYCEKSKHRVLRRVEKIISEKTGEMMTMKNPCIILEGLTCSGNYGYSRMFSRRRDYFYWREIWLERVDKNR